METRTSLQDAFLNEARRMRMPLTVFMTNGFQQKGMVISYDGYTVLLINENRQYLIYKHAISTIVPAKQLEMPKQ
ncbi:MAG: RNA chaperone Hfq [Clostridiaceae bacterium]|nr:RNA chaperone Hfq [Clostridiaceae bacterium]